VTRIAAVATRLAVLTGFAMRNLQIGSMVANQIIGAKPGLAERTR
jgi:hypothetical protein